MATLTIDFHVHVFREPAVHRLLPLKGADALKSQARHWLKPIASTLHGGQTIVRHLPSFFRKNVDWAGSLIPMAGLLIESSPSDLIQAMNDSDVHRAVVIAHPPLIPNEFILELSQEDPRLIAAVNIPVDSQRPSSQLRSMIKKGAKVLKIHPAADGEGPDSRRYLALIKVATDEGIPVILHTGCIHSPILYRKPELGEAELYQDWFKKFPTTHFVLAHMNYHDPCKALDLCEEYLNVYVDTSWQPTEMIGEAVRRVGADRVLFGTDWPFIGNNFQVGKRRIQDCIDSGMLSESDAMQILGLNACKLLGMNSDAIRVD